MNSMKNVSRFAVLGVDSDDSEDDEGRPKTKSRQVNAKNFGPYAVSNQMQKKKKRKGKQTKPQSETNKSNNNDWQDTDDRLVEIEETQLRQAVILSRQEFEEEELRRKEHDRVVAETIERSKSDQKNASKNEVTSGVSDVDHRNGDVAVAEAADPLTSFISELDEEAKRIHRQRPNMGSGDGGRNPVLILYRDKCVQLQKTLQSKDEELKKLRSDLDKAKQKNKKYSQILNETETREKAEIVVERDKVKTLNSELTEQVTLISAELEQSKSRNHELEIEIKKLQAIKVAK